ncbi:PREDICTED: protein unc-93 homolog A-like [Priapulus caudatus]|uniref:Protein unc-93 homolog A-like n=1 Tax=Priapulus caudatus TaxID=37621 RepID=A0ABM1F895_PRICU|nr:PREDICTED: protein unc-93 homolog A-like [Priapulus caudatus]
MPEKLSKMNKEASIAHQKMRPEGIYHVDEIDDRSRRKLRLKIIKNLLIVGFAFMLLFTAYLAVQNLQSSLNAEAGLGTASLSVIYIGLILSCLFVPVPLMDMLGCKWTICLSILCYSPYMAANFYASWWTLMPTAFILGVGGAPLWAAKCTYLSQIASDYADLTKQSREAVISMFFGVFFMFFQSGQIWGNLISASIFKTDIVDRDVDEEEITDCGVHFCPDHVLNNTNLERPHDNQVYLLFGIYTGCSLAAAAVVAIFFDQLEQDVTRMSKTSGFKLDFSLLPDTFKHLRHLNQLLLIPLTIYSGIEEAFAAAEFTKAYITCSWGIHMVGYIMISYGVVDALWSLCGGQLTKFTGRIPMFVLGTVVHAAAILTMFLWQPHPDEKAVYFIIVIAWAIGDGVWQTQINSLYGSLFVEQKAAFSNYRLWESLGFVIAFACEQYLCTRPKLWMTLGWLTAGMILYGIVEFRNRNRTAGDSASAQPDVENVPLASIHQKEMGDKKAQNGSDNPKCEGDTLTEATKDEET